MAKVRKDINSLTEAELGDYIHALNILRERSVVNSEDPTGYDFQADLHNGQAGPCEHRSDAFLPWHRAHLYYFEKLLQETDPPRTANVTIPYWDWISEQEPGKFPAAFKKPGLISPGRNETDTSLPSDTLEIVMTETDPGWFGGFPEQHPGADGGRLEQGPHGYMHFTYIGGKMHNPSTAAEDPIYFSFHCFIDLMWAEWQRRNGRPPLTTPDHVLRGFATQPRNKSAEFSDTLDLGYEYEYTERLKAAFDVPPPSPVPNSLLVAQPLKALADADIVEELRDKEIVQLPLTATPEEGRRLVIRLKDLKVPVTGSYTLYGFVHPADVAFRPDDEDFSRRFGVGYAAMWQSHHIHTDTHSAHEATPHPHDPDPHAPDPHHPTVCNVRYFDVTAALESTPTPTEDHLLTLQFVPAPSPTGGPPQQVGPIDEVDLKDVVMEVYV
ncbi:hypothetical protein M2271_004512 [Streptomyces sp. LBL]|uniref:tyrosinase family protein n=1 Tax=Streptomyces sp. LBL TaxID=2940562 RepID=UPI0024732415|nr:tyrosinase family protein [Streptomyces sp. LBL]MDH6626695.1 hypothetical protein [Streptomyces sp. LBL]